MVAHQATTAYPNPTTLPPPRRGKRRGKRRSYAGAALASELDKVGQAPEGQRHRTVFHAACAIGELIHQLPEARTRHDLEQAALGCGLVAADARRTVARGLERGKRHPRNAPEGLPGIAGADGGDVVLALLAWWSRAAAAAEPGRVGSTVLRVQAGLLLLALSAGKIDLGDSLRQVAEAAGVAHVTVWRHRRALEPWVTVLEVGNRFDGSRHRWRINLTAGLVAGTGTTDTPSDLLRAEKNKPSTRGCGTASGLFFSARIPQRDTLSDPAHDLWGPSSGAWRLFLLLDDDEGHTAKELAAAMGYCSGSVRRLASQLRSQGLAWRDDEGRWRLVSGAVPRPEDVGDYQERRKVRHAKHRADYRRWQEGHRADKQRRRREWTATDEAWEAEREQGPGVDWETGEVLAVATNEWCPPEWSDLAELEWSDLADVVLPGDRP